MKIRDRKMKVHIQRLEALLSQAWSRRVEKSRAEMLSSQFVSSLTGREEAAVCGKGRHVYSLYADIIFDSNSLAEAVTPAAVVRRLPFGDYGITLRTMNMLSSSKDSVPHFVRSAGPKGREAFAVCL